MEAYYISFVLGLSILAGYKAYTTNTKPIVNLTHKQMQGRNRYISKLYREGAKKEELMAKYSLSRGRVNEIIKEHRPIEL